MIDNNALIRVEGLKKHYLNGAVKALDGINCTINKGEVAVIVGPSGSGKSTMLRCINLLEKPTKGTIIVDDFNITEKKADINMIRRNIGWFITFYRNKPDFT